MMGDIVHDGATGQALIASTLTPVDTILEALQAGDSHEDVLRAHPGLTADDIATAVRFARLAVQRGARSPASDEMPRSSGPVARETAAPCGIDVTVAGTQRSLERKRARLAYAQGRGVLFFTGHFGFWELHAIVHGLHGHINITVAGNQHDRLLGITSMQGLHQRQTIHARHANVQHHDLRAQRFCEL